MADYAMEKVPDVQAELACACDELADDETAGHACRHRAYLEDWELGKKVDRLFKLEHSRRSFEENIRSCERQQEKIIREIICNHPIALDYTHSVLFSHFPDDD